MRFSDIESHTKGLPAVSSSGVDMKPFFTYSTFKLKRELTHAARRKAALPSFCVRCRFIICPERDIDSLLGRMLRSRPQRGVLHSRKFPKIGLNNKCDNKPINGATSQIIQLHNYNRAANRPRCGPAEEGKACVVGVGGEI